MITALLIGAGALYLLRKHKAVSGIGATNKQPRRIWAELDIAQQRGIDFEDPTGWKGHEQILRRLADGKIKDTGTKPLEQRYFNQLRRAYKSIAGTGLPSEDHTIRNKYGDVILIYKDYHLWELPKIAANWMIDQAIPGMKTDPYAVGYWYTVARIAQGAKFVWASKGTHRGIEMLVFGRSVPSERKARISYLATPEKNGMYPEAFAHSIWEGIYDMQGDDQEITNGVLEAIRTITSTGEAQNICIDEYMKAHAPAEPLLYQEVPF